MKSKLFFIGLIVLILLSVSCVSANQDDTVLANDNDNILALDEDDIQVQANEGENEALSAEKGSYSELEQAFLDNDIFNFEKDYEAGSGDGVINIKKSIEINGKGHSIDAKGYTGIFQADSSESDNIDITIKNLIFKNGKRDFGGAIFVDGADNVRLTLINCTFIKNQANEDGGAIYFDSSGGELVIVDSAFNKNEGLFSANHKSNGGTINVQDADLFTIDGSYFKDSHAYGHGGAIYSNVILSIDRSNFEGNDAVGKGGMLYLNGNHNFLNVTNSRFYNNGATNDGGVFFIDDTVDTIQLKDCNFTYNLASGYDVVTSGGVIFNNGGGTIYAINSNFTENRAIFTGVFIFSEVVYDFRGGAIYTGADMYISGCEFINNTASNKGGAVYAGGSILWGDPSVFKENYVSESYSYHGGAVYAGTFANTAKGLIFINNKAGYGGAVYINNKNEATFESCYFENNRANDPTEGKSRGAAIYLDSSSSKLSLINNIFVNNEATSDKAVYNCGSYATVEENWWGVNNPNFDEPYLVEWHRIGDDTKHSDSSPLSIVLTADNNLTNLGESARLTLKFVDANGADITGKLINWDVAFSSDKIARFEEKNVGDNKATVVFTPIETGTHTITAQVNNQKVSITIDINGEFNYLQYLIDNAEGALVLERDFTYSLGIDNITEGVLINKTFVIDGQGHTINALGQSRIFNIASDNVIISNITLLNGLADYGGAVLVDHTSGNIFMDCNFTNNKANNYGGAIHTTGGDAPHIVNCNFNDNTANIGGAITLDAPNSIVSQSNFSNNSAVQGGAIYGLRSFIRVDECEFNSNSADYGGAIYFKFNNCTVSYSNFENNVASETGGAIMIEGRNASIVNSRFMSNKAKASEIISNTTDALILTLIGSENYINAITSPNPVTFANVTYWNGRMTNDDPVDSFNVAGLDITIEIYNGDVLVKNVTLMTNLSGQVNYNYYELDDGNYTFNAYHADSSFYTRVSTTGKFNFTRPNSLSIVTINITDGKEFQYGECNISFEIINRTDVRVVISNQDGSEIYFDQNTDLNYVMPRLNAKEEYYNITVYNLGDKDHSPSKDSKLFKINKNNSTVVINPIEGVYYGDNITISYNGFADLYLVGIFINGTDTSVFIKQTSENSVTVGNLDSGVYEVIVMALGDNIAESSRNSTIFQVKVKETNTFNVTVGEVTYGENATITVRAKIDGVYAVDINSTIIEVNVTGGIGSASIMLGAGSYYANVTSNNTNYIANSTNTTFTVDKARSIVFINEDSFANIQPDKEFIVFINDPYPTTYNVTLYDEADHINYTAIISSTSFTLPGLELGDYNLTVTNLGNENVTGSSYSFIFDVTNKNNVKITVDDADYGKDLLIFIYAHADGFYYVYINGTEVIIEVKNGFGSYDGDLKLAAGDYYANVTYDDPFYETIAENTTFTIYKSESNIRITGLGNIGKGNALQFYDDYPTIFNVTIKDKEGNVVLNQLTDAMSVDLSILDVGQYTANITNIGNENVSSDSASIIFTVYDLSVDVDGKIVTVSVADNATGNVTLKIDNKTFTKELENGSAIFQLGNVTSGYHNATISYAGDDNYEGISKEMTVLVAKLSIIASDVTYPGDVVVTVESDVAGNYSLFVGTSSPRYVVLEAGVARDVSFAGLGAGTYEFTVALPESGNYNEVRKSVNATVAKADVNVSISAVDVTYPGDVVVTVESDVAGNYSLFVGTSSPRYVVLEAGVARDVSFAGLGAGTYEFTVALPESGNYNEVRKSVNATVAKADVNVSISAVDVTYPGDVVVTVESDVAGNYSLFIGTSSPRYVVLEAGVASDVSFAGLDAGTYEFTIALPESANYNEVSKSVNATVAKGDINAIITASDAIYPGDVVVTVESDVAGNYSVFVGTASPRYVVLEAGVASDVSFAGLDAGTYEFTIALPESGNYNEVRKSVNATVAKADINVTITAVDVTYPGDVVVTVESDVAGNYSLFVGTSSPRYVVLEAGVASDVSFAGLDAGTYEFTVALPESINYAAASKSVNITVNKGNATIDVDVTSPVAGENATVTVTLPGDATGNVSVKYGNGVYFADITNGTALVSIPTTVAGTENATVTYSGDNNYDPVSSEVNITVKVQGIIIAENIRRGVNSSYDYYATLINAEGQPISDVEITFTIEGKTYKATTNASGIATVSAGLEVVDGKDTVYNVTVTNPYTFENTTATTTIVPRLIVISGDLTADYLENPPYIVQAIGDDGEHVGANVTVRIVFAGFYYDLQTNETGHVVRTIGLAPGTYAVRGEYLGYKTEETPFEVLQILQASSGTIKKTAKKYTLKATLKHTNGKAIAGAVVKLNFNGKNYKVKTNSKGVASYTIKSSAIKKLKAGKTYVLKALYVNDWTRGHWQGKIKVVKK